MNLLQAALISAVTAGTILFSVFLFHVTTLLRARGYPGSLFDHLSIICYLPQATVAEKDLQRRDMLIRMKSRPRTSLLVSFAFFGAFCITLIWWPVSLR